MLWPSEFLRHRWPVTNPVVRPKARDGGLLEMTTELADGNSFNQLAEHAFLTAYIKLVRIQSEMDLLGSNSTASSAGQVHG